MHELMDAVVLSGSPFVDFAMGLVTALCLAIAALLLSARIRSRQDQSANPLSDLFTGNRLGAEAELAERIYTSARMSPHNRPLGRQRRQERRVAPRHLHGAVLRGRIDHISQVGTVWGQEARDEAIAQVAQVMRAGLRKTDMLVEAEGPRGDGSFVILANGANEAEGGSIAKRLTQEIALADVQAIDKGFGLTASFGVAARRPDETAQQWHARASSALDAAQATGEHNVVTSTQWEEIALLPAPKGDHHSVSAKVA